MYLIYVAPYDNLYVYNIESISSAAWTTLYIVVFLCRRNIVCRNRQKNIINIHEMCKGSGEKCPALYMYSSISNK